MTALAQTVYVNDVRYPAGTDHTSMPIDVVDAVRNPGAWVGGVAPELSAALVGHGDIKPLDLRTTARARAALGLAATGDGLTAPAVTVAGAYTLRAADVGSVVETAASSAVTVTVPNNTTAALPVGSVVGVLQYGTGQVTLAPASGVTLLSAASLTTRARYSMVSLRKRATNEWIVTGDLT